MEALQTSIESGNQKTRILKKEQFLKTIVIIACIAARNIAMHFIHRIVQGDEEMAMQRVSCSYSSTFNTHTVFCFQPQTLMYKKLS